MVNYTENYSMLSDQELIERLTAKPTDEKIHNYFHTKICRRILRYISENIYNHSNDYELWGEFYEFISKNDWEVVRKWENKNGASLYTYLTYCATNHFVKERLKEKRLKEQFIPTPPEEIHERFANISNEENDEIPSQLIWKAFNTLNVRDQKILQLLVIDGCTIMEAAPQIWEHIKSKGTLEKTETKRVQCTIAMAKRRAQLALYNKLKNTEPGFY